MTLARQPQQEYICNDDDLGCLYDYMMAAMAGNDISELPRLWNQEIGVIKSRPHTSPPAPAAGMTADELWDYSNDLAEVAAKAEREQFIEQIEDKLPKYPSDLGDMYLLSDIKSLRAQPEPQQEGRR